MSDEKPVLLDNTEVIWIQKNQEFLWANHPGKWIAVQGDQLIAVGDSASEVHAEARRKGFDDPLIAGVRKREYQNVKMIRRL